MRNSEELTEMIRRLRVIDENCFDIVVDLRKIKFHSDDEEMYIQDEITDTRYHFKASNANPKDPVRSNALKQWCKLIGVPFPFFIDNRPPMRNQVVKQWLSAVAPEEGDESLAMLRIREGGLTKVIRAVLPINYSVLPIHEIVTTLAMFPEDVTVDVDPDTCTGIERDALLTHVRVLYEKELDGEYSVGVSVTTSEVGTSDLIIDAFLYHKETKTYLVALYGGQPFAKIQYAKVQPTEVQEMLSSIPSRVQEEAERYLETLNQSEDSYPGVTRAAILLGKMKGAPKKLQTSMLLEAQNAEYVMGTSKDFLCRAGIVAKNFDTNSRLKIERIIGSFGGLKYEKK